MTQGVVAGVSVAHGHASLDDIEAIGATDEVTRLQRLLDREAVREAFVLETCNRAEAYVVAPTQADGRAALDAVIPELDTVNPQWFGHEDALEHLLRVAAGLESMILGEDEILGQLRTARETARAVDGLGPVLSEGTQKAIRVGERARTETAINDGVISIGRAAVDVAAERTQLAGGVGVIVGAGQMGTIVARAMVDAGIGRLIICNRTVDRATTLVDQLEVDATTRELSDVAAAVSIADIVVSATGSPGPLMDRATFADAGETTVVDIARPRDVVPTVAQIPGVELLDLDDLEERTASTKRERGRAVNAVERIIETELDRLDAQLKRKQADAVIAMMYESATAIKQRELETACEKLERRGGLDPEEREIIDAMADAIVGQIMAAPTKSLRDAAEREEWETLQAALQLFDPDFSSGAVSGADRTGPGSTGQVADDT